MWSWAVRESRSVLTAGLQGQRFATGVRAARNAVGCRMSASLVERFWVARVKRQVAAREVAHPQAATLKMPGYSFTEGVNEPVQRRRLTRLGPSQAPARVCVEVNPGQKQQW